MALGNLDVFEYFTMQSLLKAVREVATLKDLAEGVGVFPSKIHSIVSGKPHLVLAELRGWKKALKLSREEGQYFELLAIIAEYKQSVRKEQLLDRALLLIGFLQVKVDSQADAINSLFYWLDPFTSILRNMVDIYSFPSDEKEIPEWVLNHFSNLRILGTHKDARLSRVENTWNWFKRRNIVIFSNELGRWVKSQPSFYSPGKKTVDIMDVQSAILSFCQINSHVECIREAGSDSVLFDLLATFAVPSAIFDALEKVGIDFLFEDILEKFTYICNEDDMDEMKKKNPKRHKTLIDYRSYLEKKGIDVPLVDSSQVDSLVEVLLVARRATK